MSLLERRRDDIEYHLSKYPEGHRQSAVMPLLFIAQEEYGHITEEAVEEVGQIVGLSPTEVKGLVGFYTMYYDEPKGKYLIYVCTDLPCALRGAEVVSEHVCEHLGIEPGETTDDGLFTVENVMCIGACHRAPVLQVNFHFHEHMDEEKAEELIESLRREHQATQPYRSE